MISREFPNDHTHAIVGFSVAIPNSPAQTRITVFPTRTVSGSQSPASHEVSVAITTLPVVTSRSSQNPSHNVIITEVQPDSVDDVDDTIDDFGRPAGIGAFLARQNSDGASSVQHATLRQMLPAVGGDAALASSAPSTLAKAKTEPKTGEVYV